MPVVQCDIRRGRTESQRRELCAEITRVVSQYTGASPTTILVLVREHAGGSFMEGGEMLPDYLPGPDGRDLAGEAVAARFSR
jgi:4-oxalocrotonate tautomerase family enzyme